MKGIAVGSMAYSISTLFNDLNEELKMQVVQANANNSKKNEKELENFKNKIIAELNADLSQKLKVSINQNITGPILKFIGNKLVDKASSAFANSFKKRIQNKKEVKYSREAAEVEVDKRRLDKIKDKSETEIQEHANLEKLSNKIKGKTRNPDTLAKLAKLDLPMGDVEMEATALLLGIRMEVTYEGVKHVFGRDGDKPVQVDLEDGHFPNSSDGKRVITNDCLYNSLKDQNKIDNNLSPAQLRNGVAKIIVSDPAVRKYVADPRRNFFYKIGFYGGSKFTETFDIEFNNFVILK